MSEGSPVTRISTVRLPLYTPARPKSLRSSYDCTLPLSSYLKPSELRIAWRVTSNEYLPAFAIVFGGLLYM